jgi:hypothetical protein
MRAEQRGAGYGPQAAAMRTLPHAAHLSSTVRGPIQTPDVRIRKKPYMKQTPMRNPLHAHLPISLLVLCLSAMGVHGDIWRFTASGVVDGIGNTSTNPGPEGIVLGQPATSECIFDKSIQPLGTTSNTWYNHSILYARITIGSYTWRYIGRSDDKITCSDNHGFTQDQLIFAGNGYAADTFPLAHGGHWQVMPLNSIDQDGTMDMMTSPYIADLPASFFPENASSIVGNVRSDVVTNPRWYVRFSIDPATIEFQPVAAPFLSHIVQSNNTLSLMTANLTPSRTYNLESVATITDTNWQAVASFPLISSFDPVSIELPSGEDTGFFRVRSP